MGEDDAARDFDFDFGAARICGLDGLYDVPDPGAQRSLVALMEIHDKM